MSERIETSLPRALQELDERVMHDILRRGAAVGHRQGETQDRVAVAPIQLARRLRVTAGQRLGQRHIIRRRLAHARRVIRVRALPITRLALAARKVP